MNKLLNAFIHMNALDEQSTKKTMLHRLHPLVKMIGCLLFIIFVLSTFRLLELLIHLILIFIVASFAHISYSQLMKRGLIGVPLSLCLGISFILFHHRMIVYYGFVINEGIILCLLVMFKTFLCLCGVYIFIATTSFQAMVSELIYIKIPSLFVLQLIMTYRYIFVLLKEAQTMSKAYLLRNSRSHAIAFLDMGSFVGHLLVQSMNESQHIYECMKCRGFDIQKTYTNHQAFEIENVFLIMMMIGMMVLIKVVCI